MQNHTVALMGLLLCLALAMAGATGAAGGAHVTIPLDLAQAGRAGGGFACPGTDWTWTLAQVESSLGIRLEAMGSGAGNQRSRTYGTPQGEGDRVRLLGQTGFGYFQFLDGGLVAVDLDFLTNQPDMLDNDPQALYDGLAALLTAAYGEPATVSRLGVLPGAPRESLRWEAWPEDLEGRTVMQLAQLHTGGAFTGVTLGFAWLGFDMDGAADHYLLD